MTSSPQQFITVGELIARFLERCEVRCAFGVISIHNMPILDAIHSRARIRFVSARGEAGACNMADASARVSTKLGVCVTSTGTGCGNAAGAMVEALTAGTPLLHLTGQIESPYLDRDLGFIHEAQDQLGMLRAVSKAAFRIRHAHSALATLNEAVRLALTPPCGPVSIEIPIDVQAQTLNLPPELEHMGVPVGGKVIASEAALDELAQRLARSKRPMLWLGGGARGAGSAVERFMQMGWPVVTSVQGRAIVPEQHPLSLGSYNLQKPSEEFYASLDAMLAVGTRLRSNETLGYQLKLPSPLYRIDANAMAQNRAYPSDWFVHGDATDSLHALADRLQGRMQIDPALGSDLQACRARAQQSVDDALGPYSALQRSITEAAGADIWWVRDITLLNTMWGNRGPALAHARAGVHALGGGIGQGLAMAIGASVANTEHALERKTWVLVGDGGFMLNLGELACAVQEKTQMVIVLMNDHSYGVIRNIQDAAYGHRHCYVDLHNPQFEQLCASMQCAYFHLAQPQEATSVLQAAAATAGPVVVEVDMQAWGHFAVKFAGPPKKAGH